MRNKYNLMLVAVVGLSCWAGAVDLVKEGKPVAEIVLSVTATPSVKVAAKELQRHLEAMSGAKLAIVSEASTNVENHVYVGESDATRKLGVYLDDVKDDGFKIIAEKNHVVVAGRQNYYSPNALAQFQDVDRSNRQQAWEAYTGHKWRGPSIIDLRDLNTELGLHLWDGTGTLYGAYELLAQLGMRW